MGRKNREPTGNIRGASDAARALFSSLREIRSHLIYIDADQNNLASRTLAVIILRALEDELPKAYKSKRLYFRSYVEANSDTPTPYPLTTLEVSTWGTRIVPLFALSNTPRGLLPFRQWMSECVLFPQDTGLGNFPNAEKLYPSLSRVELLRMARNEIGAHFDARTSHSHDSVNHDFKMLDLKVNGSEDEQRERNNSPHEWTYLSATIACIAYEVITSLRIEGDEGNFEIICDRPQAAS